MILELNRLTDAQLLILKDAVGRGVWDHISREEDITPRLSDVIAIRLRAEGYDIPLIDIYD